MKWEKQFQEIGKRMAKELSKQSFSARQNITGISKSGDPQFDVDKAAEDIIYSELKNISSEYDLAYFSEGKGLVSFSNEPEYVFVVDPIDGSRPFAAGMENCNLSVAVARTKGKQLNEISFEDIEAGFLFELKNDSYIYAEAGQGISSFQSGNKIGSKPTDNNELDRLFWSFEYNGTPSKVVQLLIGDLIDRSANKGGVFLFNSASYSISRVVLGQLHAYVDIGNLVLRKFPSLEQKFKNVGSGSVLHLFPYDIAAAYLIAKEAGIPIGDGEGKPLDGIKLLDTSIENQTSCICAANKELFSRIVDLIKTNLENKQNEIVELQ
jgi:myo-inositol-1(or 4)-monophosphatase